MTALFSQQRVTPTATDPRAPSPRPSTSSASRRKKPALDFEEALNNPETLYLRPDSVLGSLDGDTFDSVDDDAPLPVEKLSFEEELRGGRLPIVGGDVASGQLGTPVLGPREQPSTPIVVPPTPTSGMASSTKRDTLYSMASSNGSALSGSSEQRSDGLLARVKTGSSSNVDHSAGERKLSNDATPSASAKPRTPARQRSLVRSPGTASSPDLATLVKKAREARAALPSPNGVQSPKTPTTSSPSVPAKSTRRAPPPPLDVPSLPRPSTSTRDRSASQGGTLRAGSGAATASAATQAQEWQNFTANGAGIRSVGSGIAGGKPRQLSSEPDDGFKSMSKRAKGMFGRMFGNKDKSIPAASRKPVGYNASTDSFYPPAANPSSVRIPRASVESAQRQRTESTGTDDSEHLPRETIALRLEAVKASEQSGFSSQPRKRHDSDLDKPLPPIAASSSSGSPQPRRQQASVNANRNSMHLRQPATGEADLMSSPKPDSGEWQDHVNDVFESIGTDEPHHGLGLPPSAVSSANDQRKGLGKSTDVDTIATSDPPKSVASPPVSQRTSSLPSRLPTLGAQIATDQRVTSSPLKFERSRTTSGATRSEFGINGDPLAITPQTIRLLSSNRPRSYIEQPSPVKPFESPRAVGRPDSAGSWSQDLSTPSKGNVADEPLETVSTPEGQKEMEEERGRKLACEFLEDDESHVTKDKIAVFLGGTRPANKAALRYYMQYFDWSGQRLDNAFRELCSKLHLKAETQEISRILEGFSERYYECNTGTIYGSAAIVYVVTGSFLLLNTDLHIAEISSHMSRSQFVRLTMETINHSIQSDRGSTPDLVRDDSSSSRGPMTSTQSVASGAQTSGSPSTLRNVRTRPDSALSNVTASPSGTTVAQSSVTSVSASVSSSDARVVSSGSASIASASQTRSWEAEMENVLKDIYAAVKNSQILLPISNAAVSNRHSMVSLGSASPYSTMGRTRSMRNASGSSSDRVNVLKRGSVRGVQSLLSSSPYGAGLDGRISPTPSVATSIGEGFNLQHFGAMGFASNLSHSVIKEHDDEARSISSATSTSTADEMTDDELALLGAPWAKEGLLSRKQYWEAPNRRAKQKEWNKYFVVIQKGDLHLFVFGAGGSSSRGGAMGGGNWMANATPIDEINLSHAMASALPKPGYNAARPYCFSITLPGGEMSFYQAGTEDLVEEWVSTCNYWAARRSRPPLQGGVSNMEYGWNRVGDSDDRDDTMSVMSSKSGRSRIGTLGRRSFGNLDKIHINDWKPAQPTLMPSKLDEEAQLESLQTYTKSLVADLEAHKGLEEPMKRLFAPRSANGAKALENWKAKFLFIHSEIIKYETYIGALKDAISLRLKKQGERNMNKALKRAGQADSDEDDDVVYQGGDVFGRGTGVLDEEDEPVTPSQRHFRGI